MSRSARLFTLILLLAADKAAWALSTASLPWLDARVQEGHVVRVIDAATLVIDSGRGPETIEVIGVDVSNLCYRGQGTIWAKNIFTRLNLVYIYSDSHYAASGRRVGFDWNGSFVDYGITAIRTGNAAFGGVDTQYRDRYAVAESEAVAEHRGQWGSCVSPLSQFASTASITGFPPEILYSIAMNESRRHGRPWPWTLNVAGKAYYFEDRIGAWRAAENLRRKKFDRFDIGVMQINWHYHGKLFSNVWEALDPEVNQRVAAVILAHHYFRSGSLARAIGSYHSSKPERAHAYLRRFVVHYGRAIEMRAVGNVEKMKNIHRFSQSRMQAHVLK
jgi:hypothetical protein